MVIIPERVIYKNTAYYHHRSTISIAFAYIKYLSKCQNKEKDVIIQIYVLESTDKFDRFESWSLQFLLLNDKELVYDEYISLEFKKSFIYYMNRFSAGMKVIDPDKRIFRSCNKLYEKWNEKYLF